jgi:hypothetical protein
MSTRRTSSVSSMGSNYNTPTLTPVMDCVSRDTTLTELADDTNMTSVSSNKSVDPLVKMVNQKLKLNVGGTVFMTSAATLENGPSSLLASLNTNSEYYDQEENAFFFDRDPEIFAAILNFYRWGELHVPKTVCAAGLRKDLAFWKIPETCVSVCCWKVFHDLDKQESVLKELMQDEDWSSAVSKEYMTSWRCRLWLILDKPTSSRIAKVNYLLVLVYGREN